MLIRLFGICQPLDLSSRPDENEEMIVTPNFDAGKPERIVVGLKERTPHVQPFRTF